VSHVNPLQKFIGGALMAVGGLIAALCGTCTVATIGYGLFDSLGGGVAADDLVSGVVMLGLIGGVPTVLGVLLFRWGWRLFRPPRPSARALAATFRDPEEDRP
jgi:hypothetical protein